MPQVGVQGITLSEPMNVQGDCCCPMKPQMLLTGLMLTGLCACHTLTKPDAQAPAASQALPEATEAKTEVAEPVITERSLLDNSQFSYHLMLAQVAADRGQHEMAATNFVFVATELKDKTLFKRAAEQALLAKRFDLLQRASDGWLQAEPNDLLALSLSLIAGLNLGDGDKARLEAWLQHPKQTPSNLQVNTRELWQQTPSLKLSALATQLQSPQSELLRLYLTGLESDWHSKIKALENYLSQHPQIWPVRYSLIEGYLQQGNFEAVEPLLSAVKPADLSDDELEQAVTAWQQIGKLSHSLEWIKARLKQKPQWHQGRETLALYLALDKQFAAAETELQQLEAAQWQPDYVHFDRLSMQTRQQQWSQAQASFEQIVDPDRQRAALLLFMTTNPDPAQTKAAFDRLYRDWPEGSGRWLGTEARRWLKQLKQPEYLAQRLQTLQQQQADLPELRLANIRLALYRQQPLQAVQQLKNWFELLDLAQQVQIFDELVWFSDQPTSTTQLLVPLADSLLAKHPDSMEMHYGRSILASALKDWDRALLEMDWLLARYPDDGEFLNSKGYTLLEAGRERPLAGKLLQQALQASPTEAHIMDSLGWFYHLDGQPEAARQWLTRAWRIDKKTSIGKHLLEVLQGLGDTAAVQALQAELQTLKPYTD